MVCWINDENVIELINNELSKSKVFWLRTGKHKLGYFQNAHCGLDIETTQKTIKAKNKKERDIHLAFTYLISIQLNNLTIRCNHWQEVSRLFDIIKAILEPKEGQKFLILIHNLSFESAFFRKHFKITKTFAREKRKPISIEIDNWIEIRDSALISGYSLEKLAKNFTTTQKSKGDLDYTKDRNYTDAHHMTLTEYGYTDNDVIILKEYSEYLWKTYMLKERYLPLTKTGIVRHEIKKGVIYQTKNAVKLCYPTVDQYNYIIGKIFKGGYCHGNIRYFSRTIYNVASYDITSSYPFVILNTNYYYPMSKLIEINVKKLTKDKLEYYLTNKCCFLTITAKGIKNKTNHSIESISKVDNLENYISDNGRLVSADSGTFYFTELDFEIFQNFYECEEIYIDRLIISNRGIMPKYVREPLQKFYEIKQKIKIEGVTEENQQEYMNAKGNVNSFYGVMVTHLELNEVYIDNNGNWADGQPIEYSERIKNEFLLPQWGVYVTSWARYRILKMYQNIDNVSRETFKSKIIYTDTDSIKVEWFEGLDDIFKKENEKIIESNKSVFGDNQLMLDIGTWDNESINDKPCYIKFKQLGCKRYIGVTQDRKFHQTIAGLGKQALKNQYRKLKQQRKESDIFDYFRKDITITESDKLTTSYTDEPYEMEINGELMQELSGVCLFKVPFQLKLDEEFYRLAMAICDKRKEVR